MWNADCSCLSPPPSFHAAAFCPLLPPRIRRRGQRGAEPLRERERARNLEGASFVVEYRGGWDRVKRAPLARRMKNCISLDSRWRREREREKERSLTNEREGGGFSRKRGCGGRRVITSREKKVLLLLGAKYQHHLPPSSLLLENGDGKERERRRRQEEKSSTSTFRKQRSAKAKEAFTLSSGSYASYRDTYPGKGKSR